MAAAAAAGTGAGAAGTSAGMAALTPRVLWSQVSELVQVRVLVPSARNVSVETPEARSLLVSCTDASSARRYELRLELFAAVEPADTEFEIGPSGVTVVLQKEAKAKWPRLHGGKAKLAHVGIDWDAFHDDDEDEPAAASKTKTSASSEAADAGDTVESSLPVAEQAAAAMERVRQLETLKAETDKLYSTRLQKSTPKMYLLFYSMAMSLGWLCVLCFLLLSCYRVLAGSSAAAAGPKPAAEDDDDNYDPEKADEDTPPQPSAPMLPFGAAVAVASFSLVHELVRLLEACGLFEIFHALLGFTPRSLAFPAIALHAGRGLVIFVFISHVPALAADGFVPALYAAFAAADAVRYLLYALQSADALMVHDSDATPPVPGAATKALSSVRRVLQLVLFPVGCACEIALLLRATFVYGFIQPDDVLFAGSTAAAALPPAVTEHLPYTRTALYVYMGLAYGLVAPYLFVGFVKAARRKPESHNAKNKQHKKKAQ